MSEHDVWDPARPVQERAGGEIRLQVRHDHVAVLEFARPPFNYFDKALIDELADACGDAASDGARSIVLCSVGKAFCAGAEFAEDTDGGELNPAALYEAGLRLFCQPLPLVVAIHGAAIGGGVGLALAGDFRIAAETAKLALNFTQLGFHPGFGTSVTLPRLVGSQAAADLFFTGRRIDGCRAAQIGLVDRAVSAEDVRSTALTLAQEIAGSAPLAVQSLRATMREELSREVADAIQHECAEQIKLFRTHDFHEGLTAVRERRIARFEGR